jgi:hypothetical protein
LPTGVKHLSFSFLDYIIIQQNQLVKYHRPDWRGLFNADQDLDLVAIRNGLDKRQLARILMFQELASEDLRQKRAG